ncbi:MAG: hypothetical protein H0T42_01680 [Deltaproteobacteria bacterium]|nr:hypothetical protein [Deltaproteobacteria bacterium]
MRAFAVLLGIVVLAATEAEARPAADLVIVWAPGAQVEPVAGVARDAGAAVIDRSPPPRGRSDAAAVVKRGIAAYDALQIADAVKLLDDARAAADRTGGEGLSQAELSDLFLYRALVKTQQGDATGAWDELTASVIVAPTRVLDPARFPPRVAAEIERARIAVAGRGTATLTIDAPINCAVAIDGVDAGKAPNPRIIGPHWVHVTCADRGPWGARVEVSGDATVAARNPPIAAPSADEMLIQARTAGARAFVAVEVVNGIATARLVGNDGRERDRRTATVTTTLMPLAAGVRELLAPPRVIEARWYQSKWVWAAGAAVIAAAILVPITAATAGDNSATEVNATFGGATWP